MRDDDGYAVLTSIDVSGVYEDLYDYSLEDSGAGVLAVVQLGYNKSDYERSHHGKIFRVLIVFKQTYENTVYQRIPIIR